MKILSLPILILFTSALVGLTSCQKPESTPQAAKKVAPASRETNLPQHQPNKYADDLSLVAQLEKLKPGIKRNADGNLSQVDLTGFSLRPINTDLLSKLKQIEVLKFRQTSISDKDLERLVHLPLRAIDLRNTNITDVGLDHLSKVKTLTDIQLEKTMVTDTGIAKLANLKIKSFNGNYCPSVSNHSFEVICSIPTIEQIQMDYTKLDDEGMKAVSAASNLKRLRIRGCDVTGKGLAHLAGLEKLERLNLRDSSVDDAGLEVISNKPDINFLDLSECRLASPRGLAKIGKMTKLTWLSLWESKANDKTLAAFSNLTKLKTLDLKATQITDASLPMLLKMTNLTELNLTGTQLTDDSFRALGKLPNLKKMNVANTSIGYEVVDELTESRPGLELIEY